MGQCVSRKGTHALARSYAADSPPTLRRGTSTQSTTAIMIHKNRSKDSSIHGIYSSLRQNTDESKGATRRAGPTPPTRGTAMSFGFRRRPVSATQVVLQDNTKPPDIDSNGNGRDLSHDLSDLHISSRLSKRDSRAAPTKFGFKQTSPTPKLTNKVSDVESKNNNFEKYRVKAPQRSDQNRNSSVGRIGKYKLSSSSLPKPQMPVRLADKNAKQVANQSKRHDDQSSSKEGSLTEGDSGVSSHTSSDHYDSVHSIRQLDYSPTYRKHRKQRQLEMVVKGKTFDVRDLNDDGTVVESSLIPLPKLPSVFQNEPQEPPRYTSLSKLMSTSTTSEESTEEKLKQDRSRTEKRLTLIPSNRETSEDSPVSSEECAGEAMIDSISISSIDNTVLTSPMNHPLITKPNTHDVLLTIEDTKFAAVAASVTGQLLEDETSPVDSLISSCTDSEEIAVAKKEKSNKMTESNTSKDINEKAGLQSPGTPTNASLSLSDGKDFFDDEIADQPSLLVFDSEMGGSETTMVEDHPSLRKSVREQQQSLDAACLEPYSPMFQRKVQKVASSQQLARANSLDTLSPCDSIASDDLMMDFEQSMSSGFDDSTDKLDSKHGSGYNSLDSHAGNRDFHRDVRQEWSALLNKRQRKDGSPSLSSTTSRNGSRPVPRYRSTEQSESPRSLDGSRSRIASTSSATHSPLRLSRRYQPTSTSSPTPAQLSAYDSDDSIRMERSTHGAILQDIVGVKTMLLKLKRVLQEQPDEDLLMRSETLNPFDSPMKNGNFNNNDAAAGATSLQQLLLDSVGTEDRFELADLRRQVLFLQAQLQDRERTVQQLRQQVVETASSSAPTSFCESTAEMCNAATQTERIRPMSAGPSLLQAFPMNGGEPKGPLVSLNNESPLILKKHLKSKAPSPVEYRPITIDSTPINLLRVFNHKKSEARTSRPISPAHPSGIPTRRSLSHSRIRITSTQYL